MQASGLRFERKLESGVQSAQDRLEPLSVVVFCKDGTVRHRELDAISQLIGPDPGLDAKQFGSRDAEMQETANADPDGVEFGFNRDFHDAYLGAAPLFAAPVASS